MRRTHSTAYEIAMNAMVPIRTDTYSPIAHYDFLTLLRDKIVEKRMEITGGKYYTNSRGTKLVGYYHIKDSQTQLENDLGIEMMIGYKNSYDKSMSAALAVGANVVVCGNGVIFGDLMTFRRKHTGNIREELLIKMQEAVDSLQSSFRQLSLDIDIMKNFELTPRQRAEILGVMYFKNNIVTPNQLSVVKSELNNSEHFNENTVWDLYNNITESLKHSDPIRHIENHIELHNFMREIVGITESREREPEETLTEEIIPDGTSH